MTKKSKISAPVIIAAALILSALHFFALSPMADILTENTEKRYELWQELEQAQDEISVLSTTLDEKTGTKELDRAAVLSGISEASARHNLSVDRLNAGETAQKGSLKFMTVQLEVSGYLNNIDEFFNEVCAAETANEITGFSLRNTGDFTWLSRETDENRPLAWLTLKDEKEKSKENINDEKQTENITFSSLVGDGRMRCFAELVFMGGSAENAA